jgi:hypothetical protein
MAKLSKALESIPKFGSEAEERELWKDHGLEDAVREVRVAAEGILAVMAEHGKTVRQRGT